MPISTLHRYRFRLTPFDSNDWVPQSTVLIAGIPRSGTSLVSTLVAGMQNAYCFNEIFHDVDRLQANLCRARVRLRQGGRVQNKYATASSLTTDTLRYRSVVRWQRADRHLSGEFLLGSNSNWSYLSRLEDVSLLECHLLGMFRHPVSTLGSWLSDSVRAARIPETIIEPGHTHTRWSQIDFRSNTRLGRSAELWAHYAQMMIAGAETGRLHLLPLETLGEPHVTLGFLPPPWAAQNIGDQRLRTALPADCEYTLDEIEEAVRSQGLELLYGRLVALSHRW